MRALKASIIILVLETTDALQECLASIFEQSPDDGGFEVIVVANGTPPDQLAQIAERPGLRIIPVPANLGFAGGCNLGARFAKGENLVFLNDDTAVTPGWLKPLIDRAASAPAIGAVCPKLVGFDGKLQEAGSVVWRNARTDRVGLGADPDDPRYNTSRDVDSASACGLLVRRDAWAAVGGFDEDYYPAYYEDVDLCFRLRAAGYRVVYEPKSVVRHRGSTSSTPELRLYSAEQNAERFIAKWRDELSTRRQFPGESHLATAIDDVITKPPKVSARLAERVTAPHLPGPSEAELRELAFAALRREVAFKDAFIESELRRLHQRLAKLERAQQIVRRLPVIRSIWRKTSSRLPS